MIGSWLPKFVKQIVDPSHERTSKSVPLHVIVMWKCVPKKRIHDSSDLSTVTPRGLTIKVIVVTLLIWHKRHCICMPSIHGLEHLIDANGICLLTSEQIGTITWIPVLREDGPSLCYQNNAMCYRNTESISVLKYLFTKSGQMGWKR